MNKYIIIFLVCLAPQFAIAQIGGSRSFAFVQEPVGASTFAVGGQNISLRNLDNNQFWQNPASLDTGFNQFASYNYNPYFADIRNHSLSYNHSIEKIGNFGIGINYWSYGKMIETNEFGTEIGEFSSNDYVINVGYARRFENFSYGMNMKFAHSNIQSFNASALLFDLGGQFIHPNKDLVFGMVFSNMGFPLDNFSESSKFQTPFDLKLGLSFKPQHMPMRLSATFHKLYRYDIVYDNPNAVTGFDENGDPIFDDPNDFDKISRHVVLATELLLAKGFNIQLGYNFLKRAELQIEDRKGTVGFSFGAKLKIKTVQVAFARSIDHISGGTNKINLIVDLNMFTKNRI